MTTKKVSDFKVVHFKFSDDDDPHEVFIKEHSSRNYDEDKPLGRTLFVINVPPYVDEQNLMKVFAEVGIITSLKLQKGIPSNDSQANVDIILNGFQSGYIVYKKRESLVKALNLSVLKPLVDLNDKISEGLIKYAKEYNNSICDHEELYDKAKRAVQLFDNRERERKSKEKEQVDDEGWTVITKKGKNPGIALKESVETKLNEKHKHKMKKKSLQNFYSFQIRDSKKKHLANLRQQHEEAKRKITEMKKSRTFKPY